MKSDQTFRDLEKQHHDLLEKCRKLETELELCSSRLTEICSNTSEIIFEHNLDGVISEIHPRFVHQTGYHSHELVGSKIQSLISPRYVNYYKDYLQRVKDLGKDEGLMQIVSKDGSERILEYRNYLVDCPDGTKKVHGFAVDMTERLETEQALVESEMRFKLIIDSIEDGYFEVNLNGDLVFFNNRVFEQLGYTYEDLLNLNFTRLMDDDNKKIVFDAFHKIHHDGEPIKSLEWEVVKKDGTPIFVDASISLMKNRKEEPQGFQGIIRDVTERKRSEQELTYMAYHDTLTGLFNRKAFMEKLKDSVCEAERYSYKRALLFLDLDSFKKVNDVLGHETGDKLLVEVALRLRDTLRGSDYISRLGGDEFTVILANSKRLNPERAAERIIETISAPYVINGTTIDFVSTSIGISVFPDDGHDAETLIKHADMAMYKAKERKGTFVRYKETLQSAATLKRKKKG